MQTIPPQICRTIMGSSPSSSFSIYFFLHFSLLLLISPIGKTHILAHNISALFVFGDSTVDSGNNNYIPITTAKCDFPPYGRDFPGHVPTGRFTNGRLVTDFVASYVKIKDFVPPYLDPNLSLEDLRTGVCFASGGAGFDPLTAQLSGVISIQQQLTYFKEYQSRLESSIGKEKTKNLISQSAVVISAGTNDFINNYYSHPIRNRTYTISGYQSLVLKLAQQTIQAILDTGVRMIAVVGLPPMGCVPAVITLKSNDAFTHRGCIESLSAMARDYNGLLVWKLKAMQSGGAKIIYLDIYKPLDDMIKRPQIYGFHEVNRGCCGSGLIEGTLLCNPATPVCTDDSKYIFWDAIHPTQTTYYNVFLSMRGVIQNFLQG